MGYTVSNVLIIVHVEYVDRALQLFHLMHC